MNVTWNCPYCDRAQILGKNQDTHETVLDMGSPPRYILRSEAIRCLNPDCSGLNLSAILYKATMQNHPKRGYCWISEGLPLESWRLMPESFAKPQPDYIPAALREDYTEACLIRDKSPKASATLARRCLQGMIRDFCRISKGTLNAEIDALEAAVNAGTAPLGVTPESVEAIDHVRKIGNIGAHMEKDIDLIVPIDPGEAQALIELIETLLEEWYVERQKRQVRLARVKAIREEKDAAIAAGKTSTQKSELPQLGATLPHINTPE